MEFRYYSVLAIIVFRLPHVISLGCDLSMKKPESKARTGFCGYSERFELTTWKKHPLKLEEHLDRILGNTATLIARSLAMNTTKTVCNQKIMQSPELTKYMGIALNPFMESYHRSIQLNYEEQVNNIVAQLTDLVREALQKTQEMQNRLYAIAKKFNISSFCAEEIRSIRTQTNQYVAAVYACSEESLTSVSRLGRYAKKLTKMTNKFMTDYMADASQFNFRKSNAKDAKKCIEALATVVATLSLELDLGVTNAKRHNDELCSTLAKCMEDARDTSKEQISQLEHRLYECVYA